MAKTSDPTTKEYTGGNPIKGEKSTAMYANLERESGCCEVGNTEPNPYGPYAPSGK
jgi:hypothetical protein